MPEHDAAASAEGDPPAISWKRDFLTLERTIAAFQERRLSGVAAYRPPDDNPAQGSVARLLLHHLDRCRELLCAEVNGGLDEHFQAEIASIPDQNGHNPIS